MESKNTAENELRTALKEAQAALANAEMQIDAHLQTALEAIDETKAANRIIAEKDAAIAELKKQLDAAQATIHEYENAIFEIRTAMEHIPAPLK